MEQQKELLELIHLYCRVGKKVCPLSSYGLKHIFEGLLGVYIPNEDFKVAMMLAGYRPMKSREINHRYKLKLVDVDELIDEGVYGRI